MPCPKDLIAADDETPVFDDGRNFFCYIKPTKKHSFGVLVCNMRHVYDQELSNESIQLHVHQIPSDFSDFHM